MNRTQELYTLWAVDLSPSGLAALNLLADGRFKLETKTEQDLTSPDNLPDGEILILCLSLAAWKRLFAKDQDGRKFISRMPKIIVLPEDCRVEDIEDAARFGFSAILKEPLHGDQLLALQRLTHGKVGHVSQTKTARSGADQCFQIVEHQRG